MNQISVTCFDLSAQNFGVLTEFMTESDVIFHTEATKITCPQPKTPESETEDQRKKLSPDCGKISVFECDNPCPSVIFAYPEKSLIRIQSVGYDTNPQARKIFPQLFCQPCGGFQFTVLFPVISFRILHPFRSERNAKTVLTYQLRFRNIVRIRHFSAFGSSARTTLTMSLINIHHMCSVSSHSEAHPEKSELMKLKYNHLLILHI